MARREKRELLLQIDAENNADKEFDSLADSADKSTKKLSGTSAGLKKLDQDIKATTKRIGDLRDEVRKSGDFELFGDIDKQTRKLNQLTKRRKIIGPQDGEDAAEEFSAGFAGRIGPLMARAPLHPGLLAAAAGAAPALSSVIAGAVTLGIGAGAVAAGVLIAAKDPEVAGAAKAVGAQVGDALGEDIGKAFKPEVRAALSFAQTEFRKLRPELRAIGKDSAALLKPLTQGAIGFAKNILPSLRAAVHEAEPLAELMGEHLPKLGATLGGVIEDLASASESSADTIDSALTFLEVSLTIAGKALQGFALFQKAFGGVGQIFGDLMGDGEEETGTWRDSLGQLAGKLEETGSAASKTKGEVKGLAEQIAAMDEIMRNVHDANISAAEANIRYRETLAAAKEAADGHKKVTDEEQSALLDLASASNQATAALEKSGVSTADLSAKTAAARTAFINAATAMGFTQAQAEKLAGEYLDIPGVVTTKANLNKQAAERDLGSLNRSIDNTTRPRTVVVKFRQIGGLGAIGQIGMSEGGAVEGPGARGVDSLVRVLAPGEHVLSDKEVRAAGGHREIERVRKMLRGGHGSDRGMRTPSRSVAGHSGAGGVPAGAGRSAPFGWAGMERSFVQFMVTAISSAGGDPSVLRIGRGRAA
jgi:hypothetical protein